MKPGARNPKAAASPQGKDAKLRKKGAKSEDLDAEKTPEPRRRPHPKIIEVRTYKSKAKVVAAE
jgi:hypothetical protein